jgi:hypothetical protein
MHFITPSPIDKHLKYGMIIFAEKCEIVDDDVRWICIKTIMGTRLLPITISPSISHQFHHGYGQMFTHFQSAFVPQNVFDYSSICSSTQKYPSMIDSWMHILDLIPEAIAFDNGD